MTSSDLRTEFQAINAGFTSLATEAERDAGYRRMDAILVALDALQQAGETDALEGLWG